MDERRRSVAAIAAAHHGVFTRADWLGTGLTPRQLRTDLSGGRLLRLGVRTFSFPGHPPSWEQRLRAALAEFPGAEHDAHAGGLTAGRLLGLDGFRSNDIEVTVARAARREATRSSVVVRSHSQLLAVDRIEIDGFASLSASRLIVEEAGRWPASTLEAAVDSAIRLGWTSETFLRRRLAGLRAPGKRGVRLLDRVLEGAGGHSWLEREFLRVVRAAGIPEPRTQVTFRRGGTIIARVDSIWPEHALIVEVAGHASHSSRRDRQRDAQRQSELALLGHRVLTFTYEDVTERPGWIVAVLGRAIRRAA